MVYINEIQGSNMIIHKEAGHVCSAFRLYLMYSEFCLKGTDHSEDIGLDGK